MKQNKAMSEEQQKKHTSTTSTHGRATTHAVVWRKSFCFVLFWCWHERKKEYRDKGRERESVKWWLQVLLVLYGVSQQMPLFSIFLFYFYLLLFVIVWICFCWCCYLSIKRLQLQYSTQQRFRRRVIRESAIWVLILIAGR